MKKQSQQLTLAAFKDEVRVVILFAALVLAITAASLFVSPPSSQIGTLRALARIPAHGLILALAGAAVAAISFPFSRRISLGMMLVGVSSVIILDLDHLPVILAVGQPIRPAHSLVFIGFAFVVIEGAFRKRPELGIMVLSASLIHLVVDAGEAPLLAPITFHYFGLSQLRPALLVTSVVLAALAGYVQRRTLVRDEKEKHLLFKTVPGERRNP